ncbi:MAG TPA: winged helix-turn-helix domain-containing protein [Thermoanaerobaculia bacterium]|nr:winged helix-turn-helix domain-containing protein [Thermoanaerobaculia bacterium]
MSALQGEIPVRSSLEEAQILAFGPFTLDARTLELSRDGEIVSIAPQPARLLAALAARAGELVTREELRQRVWGNDTFVDFERGLNFCVLQARTALGDEAKNPRYIETLPKRGYRFIAAVQRLDVARVAKPSHPHFASLGIAAVILAILFFALQPQPSTRHLTSHVPAAHEAYLRGRQLYQQRATPRIEESVVELRKAILLEPDFALPYVALADSLHALAMRERVAPRDAAIEIRNASTRALQLAPDYGGAHATEAMRQFWYEWNWEAAETSYRKAIALDARNGSALHDHGWLLIIRGRFDEGIAEIRRAQELEPANPRANMHVAWAYIYTGRFDDAIREANRALELSPGFEEALACLESAYRFSGRTGTAEATRVQRGGAIDAGDGNDFYANAVRHVRFGDRDGAMAWLAKAKEARNTSVPLMGVDPKLARLHGDARFREMLKSMGLRPRQAADSVR